jgi:adenosylhomocysteine nucleosidase
MISSGPLSARLHTLVCFALSQEARPFCRRIGPSAGIATLVTGIGRRNATQSVERFLADARPGRVFTCGFAGALNPALPVGTVCGTAADPELARQLTAVGVRPTIFYSSDRMLIWAGEKGQLHTATGAEAVEMESAAIHEVCARRGIPCATLRVISDGAHEDLPLDFNALSNSDHSLNYPRLALAVLRSPGKIPALRRLQQQTKHAAEQLAEALVKLCQPA